MKINLISHWQREVVYHTRSKNNSYEATGNAPRHVLIKNTYRRETSSKAKYCPTPELLKGFSSLDSSLHLREDLTEMWGSNVWLRFLPYKVSAIS